MPKKHLTSKACAFVQSDQCLLVFTVENLAFKFKLNMGRRPRNNGQNSSRSACAYAPAQSDQIFAIENNNNSKQKKKKQKKKQKKKRKYVLSGTCPLFLLNLHVTFFKHSHSVCTNARISER